MEAVERWDVDDSGTITCGEFMLALNELGFATTHERVEALIDELDADGSGDVDMQELKMWLIRDPSGEPANELRDKVRANGAALVRLFTMWDLDGDGLIGLSEFQRALAELDISSPIEALRVVFGELDTDRSEKISLAEFNDYLHKKMHSKRRWQEYLRKCVSSFGGRIIDLFRQWDTDNDGMISAGEIGLALAELGVSASQAEIKRLFREIDDDNSGIVSFPELRRWLEKSESAGSNGVSSQVHRACEAKLKAAGGPNPKAERDLEQRELVVQRRLQTAESAAADSGTLHSLASQTGNATRGSTRGLGSASTSTLHFTRQMTNKLPPAGRACATSVSSRPLSRRPTSVPRQSAQRSTAGIMYGCDRFGTFTPSVAACKARQDSASSVQPLTRTLSFAVSPRTFSVLSTAEGLDIGYGNASKMCTSKETLSAARALFTTHTNSTDSRARMLTPPPPWEHTSVGVRGGVGVRGPHGYRRNTLKLDLTS